MDNQNLTSQEKELIQDFFAPDEERIRLLQAILIEESGYQVTFEDAEEIGIQLITLYECLARDMKIIRGDKVNELTG